MKIFLDANIWLRFLVKDNDQAQICSELIEAVENGKIITYSSSLVLLEVFFILTSKSHYRLSKTEGLDKISTISHLRNLTIIDDCQFSQAVEWSKKYNIKLSDCLIATQVPARVVLCSYDKDFVKLPKLVVKTPKDILGELG